MAPTPLHRALVALAVFTFASWGLIAAAILLWAPGRGLAANAVARIAHAAAVTPAAGPLAAAAMTDVVPCSGIAYSFADAPAPDFSWTVGGDGETVADDWSRGRSPATGRNEFWFRDGNDEYVVHDPMIVQQVREVSRPLRDMGREMGDVGRAMGRRGAMIGRLSGRLGELSAKLALLQVRAARAGSSRESREQVERLRGEMADLRAQLMRDAWTGHDRARLSYRMRELSTARREALREVRERVREISRRARREGKAERPHANA